MATLSLYWWLGVIQFVVCGALGMIFAFLDKDEMNHAEQIACTVLVVFLGILAIFGLLVAARG